MQEITVPTRQRSQFIDITGEIQTIVAKSGVQEGLCHVFVPHTTAGVTINENADPDVVRDMEMVLERLAPWRGGYAHSEGNSAAHVKSSLMGSSQTLIIQNGRLALGTWQSVYFCEFDGPRTRKAWVRIFGGGG
ncbi:MAG TPA: secondary thiamine-phosphate synthase enzyme YjbQ [Candidatus Hydrogenedentes bacterium]|nr:secondary thiamine-phosphate synthase enzyme YjbQ [Candidatus Hydrogenedentota bacterium]HOS03539.1 secondary thiamine-phosphate synthase enzyme YjbQ [Candidatus Hydrogenedentota bacterium]